MSQAKITTPEEIPQTQVGFEMSASLHQVKISTIKQLSKLLPMNRINRWERPDGTVYFSAQVNLDGVELTFFSEDLEQEDSEEG